MTTGFRSAAKPQERYLHGGTCWSEAGAFALNLVCGILPLKLLQTAIAAVKKGHQLYINAEYDYPQKLTNHLAVALIFHHNDNIDDNNIRYHNIRLSGKPFLSL